MDFTTVRNVLRKGNVFTSVCQEFCLGGVYPSMPLTAMPCTGADTPLAPLPSACWDTHTHPGQTPPGERHRPGRADPPPGRQPLFWADPPPPTTTAADGTHPTGMHSCYHCVSPKYRCPVNLHPQCIPQWLDQSSATKEHFWWHNSQKMATPIKVLNVFYFYGISFTSCRHFKVVKVFILWQQQQWKKNIFAKKICRNKNAFQ